jgi:hypothetical protein
LKAHQEYDPAKLLKIGTGAFENSPYKAKKSSIGHQTAEVGLIVQRYTPAQWSSRGSFIEN